MSVVTETEEEADLSLLLHLALLSFESFFVILFSQQRARLANNQVPLLDRDNLEEASPEAPAGS